MSTGPIHLTSSLQYDNVDTAIRKLRAYFAALGAPAAGFTGGAFDSFDPSSTRAASENMFTADDLIAVSLLSVHVYGRAAFELLDGQRARFSALLQQTGPDRDLVTVESTSHHHFAAHDLYRALRALPQVGATTASKLMARKRPRMIPIYDSVINTHLLRGSRRLWEPLRLALRADDARLHLHLLDLRARAGLGEHISAIRVLDVLAWMDGKKYHDTPPPQSAAKERSDDASDPDL